MTAAVCFFVLGCMAWACAIITGVAVWRLTLPTPSTSAPRSTAPPPGATLTDWITHMEELAQQILDAAKALPGLYATRESAAVTAAVTAAEAAHTTQLQNIKAAIDADTADANTSGAAAPAPTPAAPAAGDQLQG